MPKGLHTISIDRLIILLIFSLYSPYLIAQSETGAADFAVVKDIQISGNRKTRARVILREMDVSIGDTIRVEDIGQILERNKKYIFNTSLFQEAHINVTNWSTSNHEMTLDIKVVEDLYIYPIPIFSLADRNFNVWWKQYNRSLERVNYGMRFYNFNSTGNQDRLKVVAQFGFQKKYELAYNRPNFNKSQTLGINNIIRYSSLKEVNYATIDDVQEFIKDEESSLFQTFLVKSELTYRPSINQYHTISFSYARHQVGNLIAEDLNPDYFLASRSDQKYFEFEYTFVNDQRDFRTYAERGSYQKFSLRKTGLGLFDDVNLFQIEAIYAKYFSLHPKWSIEAFSKARVGLNRDKPPFFNYKAFGYNQNVIRGYELYVIDAIDFGYIKTSLRFELLNSKLSLGKAMPIRGFKMMPIRFMLTFNNDIGYANDPFYSSNNELSNQLLWGGGIGIDMILYNDYVFQIEYSSNQLSEKGLFLKLKFPF
ncbi:MAG: BamA/TamA family outer membrane protein [Bacteroidia bacterium]|nr:BamA/TamA family outer membrane protein [Bacteroidia bacterium]